MDQDLDQDLARNLEKKLIAMIAMSSEDVETHIMYCHPAPSLQGGGFGGFDDDFFKGGFGALTQKWDSIPSISASVRIPPRAVSSVHIVSISFHFHFLVMSSIVKICQVLSRSSCVSKVEELQLVPSVPALEEEVEG